MQIRWYGHAAFRLTPENGPSIITDPYLPELVGYAPIPDTADLVITSSGDDDGHCRADLLPGKPEVLNAVDVIGMGGSTKVQGVEIRVLEAMEWEHHPDHAIPGQNAMYRFELDGIKIAHMGDVGNRLNAEQMAFYEDVDLLLALTGGGLTIKLPDLMEMIHIQKPKVVIPMHFRTLIYKPRRSHWVEGFLANFHDEQVDFAFGYDTELTKADIPDETRVLVMDYMR